MKKMVMFGVAAVALSLMASPVMAEGAKRGDRMFNHIDANNDGVVSEEEFNAIHEKRFDALDADDSGSVTKEEIQAHHAKMREKMKEHKARMKEKNGGYGGE